jgi:hypothetical protein
VRDFSLKNQTFILSPNFIIWKNILVAFTSKRTDGKQRGAKESLDGEGTDEFFGFQGSYAVYIFMRRGFTAYDPNSFLY